MKDSEQVEIGRKYGRFTVIDVAQSNKYKGKCFRCRCECGYQNNIELTLLVRWLFVNYSIGFVQLCLLLCPVLVYHFSGIEDVCSSGDLCKRI